MTDLTVDTTFLAYAQRHGFALFPCRAGTKTPILKWKEGSTTDPAQWDAWIAAGHNLAIDAAKSGLIVLDVDASKVTQAEAWAAWHALCFKWGLPGAVSPCTSSGRGGWHVPFRRPAVLQATDLRGGGVLVRISDVRAILPDEKDGEVIGFKNRGYCVAPGSHLTSPGGDLPYLFMGDSAPEPHTMPDAMVAELLLPVVERSVAVGSAGISQPTDVAALVAFLDMHNTFDAEPDWFNAIGAIKLACGDTEEGLLVARQITRDDASEEALLSRWNRQASSPEEKPGVRLYTLGSLIDTAEKLGKKFHVSKRIRTAAEMFAGAALPSTNASATVTQIIKDAGGTPSDALFAGQAELIRLATPYLVDFLAATALDVPSRPQADDFPTLPPVLEGHGLFHLMNAALHRIAAMIEPPQRFKPSRVVDPLGVLGAMNQPELYASVMRRITNTGHSLPTRKIKLFTEGLVEAVQRVTVTLDKWELDTRTGEPQSDNSDNVQVALGILGLSIRWNAWLERMEIQGGNDDGLRWTDWTYIDDAVVAKIRTRLNRTKTRFRPGKDFLWESLLTLSHLSTVDPVLDTLSVLQDKWDRVPRLSQWLHTYCGTPQDDYYSAVSANIIGGMVLRARHAGCKFDTMAVLYGRQGTGKSSLAAILALDPEWFTDSILLGDASKELVLSLAGKLVVEIGEMGMRGNTDANHVKAMISRQVDEGRTAYARSVTRRSRRNIFIGTTNDDEPLQDPSGNRRFMAIRIDGKVTLDALRRDIGQLIGEAAALEARGADFAIPEEVWALQAAYQEAARAISPVEELCQEWFDRPLAAYGYYITATDINRALRMAGQSGKYTTFLKKNGWRNENLVVPGTGRKARVWVRHTSDRLVGCARLLPSQTAIHGPVEMRPVMSGLPPPPC